MKKVCGVGINDANYLVHQYQGQKLIWICPFYKVWANMLERCYSKNIHQYRPSYTDCSVIEEWKLFSNFRFWMEQQDHIGKQLDKDILFPGNKIYGPYTCVFVTLRVNSFVTENKSNNSELPIGVSWYTPRGKFIAKCRNPFTGEQEYLGLFDDPNIAHSAWRLRKQELAVLLANEQNDKRIAIALINRYL